jgi:Spy/CpxP family protein refolding chaperone
MTGFSQAPMPPMGQPAPANAGGQNKPPMMGEHGEMSGMAPGMKNDQGEMGEMAPSGMAAPAKAMGMCCMGEMGMPPGGSAGMSTATPAPGMAGMGGPVSAMPGQPGASHLLHIGSTGFFLNHSQHITLTADQKSKLNRIKEKAMLDQASEQRKIDQGEQDLYTLTGADQLDNSMVQAKIGEIEKLRTGQRMNFIQAVSEASNVLTHDQHLALLGTMPAKPAGKR